MTRPPAPVEPPVVLTIAGSDSGGGAGIQADLKTIEAHEAFGTSAITAVTAQNTTGVTSTHVLPVPEIEAQLEAVGDDFELSAVKTGMLATEPVIQAVTDFVADRSAPLVVDPVMVAASGDRLLDASAEDAYEDLIAAATVVTPNADEAAVLTDGSVSTVAEARGAARELHEMGASAALVKGGHLEGDEVTDVLVTDTTETEFTHPRVGGSASHGSGCALASAIAARLAHGDDLPEAVDRALAFMQRAIRYPIDVGEGPGSVHHLAELRAFAARGALTEDVRGIVSALVAANVRALVPEVGMNVVGAGQYAESREDTAAVNGRITRTKDGLSAGDGIALAASSHVARFLLAAREHVPTFRFCANCRFDERVEAALEALDGPVAEYERDAEPAETAATEGSTMQWAADRIYAGADRPPIAVIDRGAHGKEPMLKILAPKADLLTERLLALDAALEDRE